MVEHDHGTNGTAVSFAPTADPDQPSEQAVAVRDDAAPADAAANSDVESAVPVDVEVVETVDGEIVDEVASGAPVDTHIDTDASMYGTYLASRDANRRPVIPSWARDRGELVMFMRWLAAHTGHHLAFHSVRMPLYGGKLALRTPRGAVRVLVGAGRWLVDAEAHPLRAHAVTRLDSDMYLKLERSRNQHLRARLLLALVVLATLTALCVVLAVLAPWWAQALAITSTVTLLGLLGTPADRPLAGPAVVVWQAPRLTSDMVVKALTSLGVSELNKAGRTGSGITFPSPITRDGPGWRADVDLPHGVTVSQLLAKREELASGLRRPLGCVWPERDTESHAGRLVLFVADRDMRKAKQPRWPLDKAGIADVFKPIPFGTDPRGRIVSLKLMFANLLMGAMPRQGKTASLRIILLGLALDPNVELRIFELKGTGDLSPLEPVSHHYASGAGKAAVAATTASLRELKAELELRAKRISDLAKRNRALVPDNKVTPEVSGRRSMGLWPIVAAIDECQNLFTDEDCGAEAAQLCTDVIKLGPALGIMLLLATQRPDKDSLPKAISANVALRFCLHVSGQVENDMILGTSAYQNGLRASTFTPELDAGIGILRGMAPEAQIVRSFYKDGPAAETIIERARLVRQQNGTLTGHAIGEVPAVEVWNVLDDVTAVFQLGEDSLWSEVILSRLVELRPTVYREWTASQLAAALKPFDVLPGQVWRYDEAEGKERNRRGYSLDAIAEARASRILPAGPSANRDES